MKTRIILFTAFFFCQLLNGQTKGIDPIVSQTPETLSTEPAFLQLSPNPANEELLLTWRLPTATVVSLTVADVRGSISITLPQGLMEAGYHSKTFATAALSDGIYVASLRIGQEVLVQRFVVQHH